MEKLEYTRCQRKTFCKRTFFIRETLTLSRLIGVIAFLGFRLQIRRDERRDVVRKMIKFTTSDQT